MCNSISMPEEQLSQMRDAAIFPIARLSGSGDGFYIPGWDKFIKRYDEPWLYTVDEARREFGKLIPTVSLVQWILDEAHKMEHLRDTLSYFLPNRALPDDEDIISFLGLTGGGHLLRSDFLGKSRFLRPMVPGWYTITNTSAIAKDSKFKVRLLLS